MADSRPFGAFLQPTPTVIVPVVFAAWLDDQVGLRSLVAAAHADDRPTIRSVLEAMLSGATWHRVASANGSTSLPRIGHSAEAPAGLEVLDGKEVAARLGVGPRAVRMACQAGRLRGRKDNGRWLIDRVDLDAYLKGTAE